MKHKTAWILLLVMLICGGCSFGNAGANGKAKNDATPETIPTYEGSGQATHPSVLYFEEPWHGFSYWMAVTPYPFNNDTYENPSILASADGENWVVPEGAANPLAGTPETGHNCDVDLVYDEKLDELRMYYVEADDATGSIIYLITSKDGATWDGPQAVFDDYSVKYGILSPTIVRHEDGTYRMWYVDSGNDGWQSQSNVVKTSVSADGIHWEEASVCEDFALDNYQVWHLFIRYIKESDTYLALFPAYENGSDADHCLLFAAKKTGDQPWEFEKDPILSPGKEGDWDDLCIYRSTFLYHENKMTIWYSARKREDSSWKIGKTSVKRELK